MTQPRTKDAARHTCRLIVRLTPKQRAYLRQVAAEAGLTDSEFVRRMLINGRVEVVQESAFGAALAYELKRIGVNINQQMVIAHLDGELPPALQRLWGKLEMLLDRMVRISEREI